MCGIAGIFNLNGSPINKKNALQIRDIMSHRGPDGAESYFEKNVAILHNRLAILDTSNNGAQPMYSRDKKWIIAFNGCIYNFKELKKIIEDLELKEILNNKGKIIKIPICCDKKFALDINNLEKKLNISEEKIYEKFFSKDYYCYMTGFIAGHPFLGDTDISLRAKRLETPRVRIPKGSVGITEQFCNIYSFESPGGWNIIGNTPLNIFDNTNELKPNLINPGDTVSFEQISIDEYEKYYE